MRRFLVRVFKRLPHVRRLYVPRHLMRYLIHYCQLFIPDHKQESVHNTTCITQLLHEGSAGFFTHIRKNYVLTEIVVFLRSKRTSEFFTMVEKLFKLNEL